MASSCRRYFRKHLKHRPLNHEQGNIVLHSQNQGGVERDSYGKKAGKGALIQWEKSATLGVSQDQTLFVLNLESQAEKVDTST